MKTIVWVSLVVLVQAAMSVASPAEAPSVVPLVGASAEDLKQPSIQALLKAQYKGKQIGIDIDRTLGGEAKTLSTSLHSALNNCSDRYDNAVSHVGDSIQALLSTNVPYEDLKMWIDVAITSARVCQHALHAVTIPPGVTLFQDNAAFSDLCSNALKQVISLEDIVGKPKIPKFK